MLSRVLAVGRVLSLGVWASVALSSPTQGQPKNVSARSAPTPTPRPDQTARVEGRAFDARTKLPIAGAEMSLEGSDTDDVHRTTTTDAQGRFVFEHLAPGHYVWSVRAKGYSGRSNYGTEGFPVSAKGWKFDIPLVHQGQITGEVRDMRGRPIAGASILVLHPDGDVDTSGDAQTDQNGRFVVNELDVTFPRQSARYEVRASAPQLSDDSKTVRVQPLYRPQDGSHVSLTLRPRAVISGRLSFRGRPLSGGLVLISYQDGVDDPLSVLTDKNGRYHLSVSAPASYAVFLEADDATSQSAQVRVSPGQNAVLNRDLKPFSFGSIRGRVVNLRGRPVRDASIELWDDDTSETSTVATTDKAGRFFIPKVAPRDDYRVSVRMPGAEFRGGASTEGVRVRSGQTAHVVVRGDTVAPRLQLLSAPRVLSGTVSLRYQASDNVGLVYSHMELDGGFLSDRRGEVGFNFEKKPPREASGTWKWDSRGATNGRHRLLVEVNDRVGNKAVRQWFVWIQNTGAPKPARKPTPAPRRAGGSGY